MKITRIYKVEFSILLPACDNNLTNTDNKDTEEIETSSNSKGAIDPSVPTSNSIYSNMAMAAAKGSACSRYG